MIAGTSDLDRRIGVAQAPVIGRENGVREVRSDNILLSSRKARNWTIP